MLNHSIDLRILQSFSDAEPAEDTVQDIIGDCFASDLSQIREGLAKLEGREFQGLILFLAPDRPFNGFMGSLEGIPMAHVGNQ
jgi:hypothetical protein